MVSGGGKVLDLDGYDYDLASGEIGEDGMTGAVLTTAGGVLAHVSDGLLAIRDSVLTTAGKDGII